MVQTRADKTRRLRSNSTVTPVMTVGPQKKVHKPKSKVTLSKAVTEEKQDYDEAFPPLSPPQTLTTPEDKNDANKTPKPSPSTTDSCCKCSQMSSCRTVRCPCFAASKPCSNCEGKLCEHYNPSPSANKKNLKTKVHKVTFDINEPNGKADQTENESSSPKQVTPEESSPTISPTNVEENTNTPLEEIEEDGLIPDLSHLPVDQTRI